MSAHDEFHLTVAEADTDSGQRFLRSFREEFPKARLTLIPGPLSASNRNDVPTDTDVLSVFVDSVVDAATIQRCESLQLITTRSTGFDHIDLTESHARNIAVCNVPQYGANTVAEHTFALILALSRNVHRAWVRTQRRDFQSVGLQGFDLRRRTIGVVGTGNIGLHVVKIARGFGMNVVAADPFPNELSAEVLGFRYVRYDELFESSDIVTLHAPLIPQTERMINRDTLAKFKRGALLINTSRGGLVDTDALLWALDEQILGGAGLDVLEGEQLLSEDHWMVLADADADRLKLLLESQQLLNRENVVVTPHMAFDSIEAVERIAVTTTENITAFYENRPINTVSGA